MSVPVEIIESITVVTPLGLQFWDSVTDSAVGYGLVIAAYPADNPERQTIAFPNRSSVYVLRNLPGLRDMERGKGDADFWANLPARREFKIEVNDTSGRFQPFLLSATAPYRRLFEFECPEDSPPALTGRIPLYSSPSRPAPAGMAVVRAQLRDAVNDEPASWAVLEVSIPDAPVAKGLADEEGRVAVMFSYPGPQTDPLSSPPGSPPGSGASLFSQEWQVQLRAFYTRPQTRDVLPDLCSTLMQPEAQLWRLSNQSERLEEGTLLYGRELILRTIDPVAGEAMSELLLTPAESSPP